MTAEDFFRRFSASVLEPLLLLTFTGVVVAANRAAADLSGREPEDLRGRRLSELVRDPPATVARVLELWAGSREPTLALLSWGHGPDVPHRCDGGLLDEGGDGAPGLILVRCTARGRATGSARDVALDEKIDELTREILERRGAEAALAAQRELLKVTLASIGDAVLATDREGRVTFMNRAAELLTGWKPSEALGQPLDLVVHIVDERTRQRIESPLGQATRENRAVGLANDAVLIGRDGREMPIADSAAPIRDDRGESLGAVLVFRDVSQQKHAERDRAQLLRLEQAARAEAQRAQQRAKFLAEASTILASSLDYAATLASVARLAVPTLADWCIVDVVTPEGEIERVAVAAADPAMEAVLETLQRRYPPDWASPQPAAQALRSGKSVLFESFTEDTLAATARDREHLALIRQLEPRSAIAVPLFARGRKVGAITLATSTARQYDRADLAVAEELSGRVALAVDNAMLYRQAERARAEAEAANRAKDEFLAILSHELRTPLGTMAGWVRLLATGRLDERDRQRAIAAIERNTRLQAKLIDDLLDVSRIAAGKLSVEKRPVDLPILVREAVEAVRPDAEARRLALDASLAPSAAAVFGDPLRLQQVIGNLLSNAIKFTPESGRIHVSLDRHGPNARITVRDTGEGIDADALPRVFERFRQEEHPGRRTGGLGLGLAIVKHLIELHGGTVTAESEGKGRGSTFTVELPILAVEVGAGPRSPATARVADGFSGLAGMTILAVDDDADSRELIGWVLAQCGATVRLAGSAAEALAVIAGEAIDVLISDLAMPETDGYELLRRMRDLERVRGRRPARAIALSAQGGDHPAQAVLAGFERFAWKPVDPRQLVELVLRGSREAA